MGIIGICVRVTALLVLVMSSFTTGWGQSRLSSCPADQNIHRTNCFGTHTYASGAKYVGEYRDGKHHGHGTYTFANGDKYVGEYRDGKANGQGTYTDAKGDKYVGEFRDSKHHGQGTLMFANGRAAKSGLWREGQFVDTSMAQPSQNIPTNQIATGSAVQLIKEGGTFKVPVLINGIIPLHFIVDSGASDVRIPSDVVLTLVRTGTITNDDFIGEQTYVLADGSRVKSKTFRIRSLKVGDKVVENVLGSVADVKGSLLLGQSFLSRFKKVSFDYSQGTLVLE